MAEEVRRNLKVRIEESPVPAAKKTNTLRAVFGEPTQTRFALSRLASQWASCSQIRRTQSG